MYKHDKKQKNYYFQHEDPEKIVREKEDTVRAFSIEETQHADAGRFEEIDPE